MEVCVVVIAVICRVLYITLLQIVSQIISTMFLSGCNEGHPSSPTIFVKPSLNVLAS